jgi:copper chaperone NosL
MNFKRIRVVAAFLLFCALIVAGCRKPEMPAPISSDDACHFCKSVIANPAFAAEFLTRSGAVYKFDDMVCMIASAKELGSEKIESFYVTDSKSGTLTPAASAMFVRSDKIWTPKGGGLVAFKDMSEAQNLASRYHAELLKFNELLK